MDLLAFERKLDQTIMRKRLDIQEALKRPIKVEEESCLRPLSCPDVGLVYMAACWGGERQRESVLAAGMAWTGLLAFSV